MTEENTSQSVDLNEETRTIWDQNAAFWDENMGDGNDFQRLLVTEQGFSYRLMVFTRKCGIVRGWKFFHALFNLVCFSISCTFQGETHA